MTSCGAQPPPRRVCARPQRPSIDPHFGDIAPKFFCGPFRLSLSSWWGLLGSRQGNPSSRVPPRLVSPLMGAAEFSRSVRPESWFHIRPRMRPITVMAAWNHQYGEGGVSMHARLETRRFPKRSAAHTPAIQPHAESQRDNGFWGRCLQISWSSLRFDNAISGD